MQEASQLLSGIAANKVRSRSMGKEALSTLKFSIRSGAIRLIAHTATVEVS